MKEIFIKRIGNKQRARARIMLKDSAAEVTIVNYSFYNGQKGAWSIDKRMYDLSDQNQYNEYLGFLQSAGSCSKYEYKIALQEALKPTIRRAIKPVGGEDTPIPVEEIRRRITAFLMSGDSNKEKLGKL